MALVKITTSEAAFRGHDPALIAAALGELTYAAEGFADSAIAPDLTWVLFEQLPATAFLTATGRPPKPHYYVEVSTLRGVLTEDAKLDLGARITRELMAVEGCEPTDENTQRIWVRFLEIADGDLVVGGQATFAATLRALIAAAGQGKETPVDHPIITDPATFATAFDQALNAGDLDRLLSLYDPDAAMRISDGSVVHGHERVGQELTGLIAAEAQLENRTRHVFRHNDVALIVVDYTLRITTPDGQRADTQGTATNVLRHTPGRGWRMIIANPPGIA
ncbi:nuclear transport factor 2 family protein [Amycolatopsis sp. NPDC004079]|uniref:nuclear transport factor 2 family protein n=1 Tax=Amycolatopsis sp. NPDC004079 TaxID=3154549 RepID=UPI0033B3D0C2